MVDAEAEASSPIGILGGTGDQGRGLARRLALAGHSVVLGSRSADRAVAAAVGLTAAESGLAVTGGSNLDAARAGEVVIVAVPYEGHRALLADLAGALAGRIVVDCVNPLGFDSRGAYPLAVPEGSAAEQAAAVLPDSVVVAAFHHVSAVQLLDRGRSEVDTDVLVLGDDRPATDRIVALVDDIAGSRGVFAGRLRNAHQVEALTANLIAVNRRYKAHAGLRVTDL